MGNGKRLKIEMAVVAVLVGIFALNAFAQEAAPVAAAATGGFDIGSILAGFAAKWPMLNTIVMIVGMLRLILKPLFAIAHSVALASSNPAAEDAKVTEVETSAIMKGIFFVLDWFTSVKVGSQAK